MRVWGLRADFTTQIKLLIRSFFCSFFLSCSPSSCTHILCGHTSSYETVDMTRVFLVQCLKCLIHALCLIRVSSFHMLFCLFHFTKYLFINVFLPHSAPQILTLGSKLTWAPSAIFRLSTSLYVGAGNSRDVPTVHSTHFLSPNMGKKKVQPGTPYLNEKVWKWPKKKRRGKGGIAEHLSGLLRPTGRHTVV